MDSPQALLRMGEVSIIVDKAHKSGKKWRLAAIAAVDVWVWALDGDTDDPDSIFALEVTDLFLNISEYFGGLTVPY